MQLLFIASYLENNFVSLQLEKKIQSSKKEIKFNRKKN